MLFLMELFINVIPTAKLAQTLPVQMGYSASAYHATTASIWCMEFVIPAQIQTL
jgi:hypothetical protein